MGTLELELELDTMGTLDIDTMCTLELDITVNKIFAAMKHLVIPVFPGVDIQAILPVLWNLQQNVVIHMRFRDRLNLFSTHLEIKYDILVLDSISSTLSQIFLLNSIFIQLCNKVQNGPGLLKLNLEGKWPVLAKVYV